MPPKSRKGKIYVFCALSLPILLAAFLFWLYANPLTAAKEKIFFALPLPAARVGNHYVPMREYIFRRHLAQKISGAASIVPDSQIFAQIIKETGQGIVADKYGIRANHSQTEQALNRQDDFASPIRGLSFADSLKSFGLSRDDYINYILGPQRRLISLQIWQNSQRNLNPQAYTLAGGLMDKLNLGQEFGTLAAQYSDDAVEKNIKGDMGYVDPSLALPELKGKLVEMKIGQVEILPSRLGLHIIKLTDKQGNLGHYFEIFLKNRTFDSWLTEETKKFSIKIYANYKFFAK